LKKQFCKTMSYVMTAALLLGVSMPSSPAAAKKKAPKLSTKKVSISVGQKKTIKLKNGKKAVWSIKSGKKVVSLSKKKKTSVVVKGKKAGKAVVLAKAGKKKLTCKVTVKAKKPAVTKAPAVTTAPNTNKPSTAPTATPTAVVPAPTATPEQGEAVKNITIDMTKVGDIEFSSSPATINFSSQLDSRFDLAYFKEVKIGYELTFEGEDTSKLTAGKIAVAGTTDQLTGFDDGVAFNYNMAAGATSVSVAFDEKVTGPAVGLNIQPMDADASYGWPETLKSVKITSIVFVARAGATYPAAGAIKPTPKPTVAPEFVSSEFKYDGLDQSWIDKNIDPEKPVVALSFDDGPGGYSEFVDYGMQIQRALTAAGAHATFFYIGAHIEHDEDSRNEVLAAKEAGFEVANHSYDSNGLNSVGPEVIKEKIAKTDELLSEITGYKHFLFRAPNVAYSQAMYAVIEKPFIDVSIWSQDYQNSTTKDNLVNNVINNLKDGGIINMHSVHEKTAQAVPEILEQCKDKGYQVVSVSELFAIKGKKLMTGVKYNNAE
jgi:peptidoglycan/xylan/chitin deacetylase (PgdA/CDA1 family)